MSVIAWIFLALVSGLLANLLIPGSRSRGLALTCLTGAAGALALQLRNPPSLAEIGVGKNTTVVFPAPLMTTIAELGTFLARETAAAAPLASPASPLRTASANGSQTT